MLEPTMNPRLDILLSRAADEVATTEESAELEALLAADSTARRRYVQMMDLHAELRARHAKSVSTHVTQSLFEKSRVSFAWLSWPPLTATAAGIVFGMFCTSIVFGYAMPRAVATASRLFVLVDGSFEKTDGSVGAGFPSEFGKWSGDEAEVVSSKAIDGKKSLLFVQATREPTMQNDVAAACDVYQLVDLRPLKSEAVWGDATLELSVQFLDAREVPGEKVRFIARLHVFAGETDGLGEEWPLPQKEALATGSGVVVSTGGSPQSWQSVKTRVLLPREADFAVVHLVANKPLSKKSRTSPATFGAQFADDVRLTLKTQPALPVRLAER